MKAQWAFMAIAVSWSLAAPVAANEKATFIDLEPYQNRKLDDNQGRGYAGNTLSELPRGARVLGGIRFQIGPGLIQLGSDVLKSLPARIDGIKIKQQFSKLHILHATCFGGGPNEPGSEWHINDGTVLGYYLVHYEDQSTERIPIVYGEDVCDWFFVDGEKEPSRAKVVWTGDNEFAKSAGCHLRLYASTWTNPKPDQRVMRIDFVGRKDETPGAPVCLAMTAVRESADNATDEAKAKAHERALRRTEVDLERAGRRPPNWRPSWRQFDFNGREYYVIPLQ